MGLTQLDIIRKQIESAAKNRAAGEAAKLPDEGAEAPHICADGYVRRSPEQPLYTPPDYRRRLLRRAAGIAVAVLLALAVLWLLVHYSVLSI